MRSPGNVNQRAISTMRLATRTAVVAALGTTQTLAWASSYYLPAMLAAPMARGPGCRRADGVRGVLLCAADFRLARPLRRPGHRPLGRPAGIDGHQPGLRPGAGLAGRRAGRRRGCSRPGRCWASAWAAGSTRRRSPRWCACTAMSRATRSPASRSSRASPARSAGRCRAGWKRRSAERGACAAWAGLHLLLALPLNSLLPSAAPAQASPARHPLAEEASETPSRGTARASILLALVFAVTWFISTAMAAHLPRLLMATGACWPPPWRRGALVGPAQVGARVLEFWLLRRVHPCCRPGWPRRRTRRALRCCWPWARRRPRPSCCCMARATAFSPSPRARCRS